MTLRLGIVVSHPIQHFAPWHRELSKLESLHSKVFFCCDWGANEYRDPGFSVPIQWDVPLLDGYEHEFLRIKRRPKRLNFWSVDNPQVTGALDRFQPDVIQVFGYAYRTSWRVTFWANEHCRPVLLYSDSNARHTPLFWKRWLKASIVQRFYDRVDGALFVGDNNREYHLRYGLPADRLFPGVLPIHRERLAKTRVDRDSTRRLLRSKHGIPPDAFVVVWCGKYIPRKRPLDLVEAVNILAKRGLPVWALLVGEGELRPTLEKYCVENELTKVMLTGFVNQSEVGSYFAAADVLALTSSRDPHPLVVSEGSALGLPAIVSEHVGCVGPNDTAQPGRNALVYACGDSKGLAEAIDRLRSDPELYKSMSTASLQISRDQDVTSAADQLAFAAQELHKMGPRRARHPMQQLMS